MQFLVRIYRYKADFSALVPDLPGCVAAGDSVEQVRALISKAITLHLDLMAQSGEIIPKPSGGIELVNDRAFEDEEYWTWVDVQVPRHRKLHKKRLAAR